MNGDVFIAYIESLKVPPSSQIVTMYNLSVHKMSGIFKAIQAGGIDLLSLPPYLPDLNPIEMSFTQINL